MVCYYIYKPVRREDRSQSIVLSSLAKLAKDSPSSIAHVWFVYTPYPSRQN